eukprot:COSAG01_NODE_6017_length_3899_cov_21.556842_2_plen_36_part_00
MVFHQGRVLDDSAYTVPDLPTGHELLARDSKHNPP